MASSQNTVSVSGRGPMMGRCNGTVVYKSFGQALQALTTGPVKNTKEVRSIIEVCRRIGLVSQNSFEPNNGSIAVAGAGNKSRNPFIVIEGLDGSGKSFLTKFLKNKLQMKGLSTPPKDGYYEFATARTFFDDQDESIRRAFYSVGNYVAAKDVLESIEQVPVVMDRFWHSTAAYALANQMRSGITYEESDLEWPQDLLKPDLVILLRVSEQERLRRHANRRVFTNTEEEQTLAEDAEFRRNLLKLLQSVKGPPMVELITDGGHGQSKRGIIKAVIDKFPQLRPRLTNENFLN